MKVLCYTSPERGHLIPTVPILLELQHRCHDVVIRTIGAEVPRLRELGLKADSVSPQIEAIEMNDYGARTAQAGIKRAVVVLTRRARIEVPDVRKLIAEERPDLILVDGAQPPPQRPPGCPGRSSSTFLLPCRRTTSPRSGPA